jgi:hypothetical protein
MTVSDPRLTATMEASPHELSARDRKKVYMRSSIFDPEGPSVKNIYSRARQEKVLAEVEKLETAAKVPLDPTLLALPTPADMRLSQNEGHNSVFGPGTEDLPSVHAHQEESIPREYWKSDVNLHWADPRNELNRARPKPDPKSAKGRAAYERSSELFDWDRMTTVSTMHPAQEIQSVSEHFLANAETPHIIAAKDAHDRLRMNLDESNESSFKRTHSPEPTKEIANENPEHFERRRKEKNFSDLFETEMKERTKVKQRSGASDSMSLSWLDARAEVEARERGALVGHTSEEVFEKYDPTERRLNELKSHIPIGANEMESELHKDHRTTEQSQERICWETGTLLEAGSELARREMMREFGDDKLNAWDRKKHEQESTTNITSMQEAHAPERKPPRMTIPPIHEGLRERPMSAFERKHKNLESNIF